MCICKWQIGIHMKYPELIGWDTKIIIECAIALRKFYSALKREDVKEKVSNAGWVNR